MSFSESWDDEKLMDGGSLEQMMTWKVGWLVESKFAKCVMKKGFSSFSITVSDLIV